MALILPFAFEVGNATHPDIGYVIFNLFSAFVAAMWTAILCVQAGDFLQNCLTAIWPSFANFPNHLPESANITCKPADSWNLPSYLRLSSCSTTVFLSVLDGPNHTCRNADNQAPHPVPS